MNKKIVIVGGVIVLAGILWLGVTFPKGNPVVQQVLGSQVGPESSSSYSCNVGVCTHYLRQKMIASTTPCTLFTPAATTTLTFYGASGARGSDGDTTFDIGIGSTAYATTTTLGNFANAVAWTSGAQFEIATSSDSLIIAPNRKIVFKLATSTLSANFAPVGYCNAKLTVVGN